jgi:hypothetical protein
VESGGRGRAIGARKTMETRKTMKACVVGRPKGVRWRAPDHQRFPNKKQNWKVLLELFLLKPNRYSFFSHLVQLSLLIIRLEDVMVVYFFT